MSTLRKLFLFVVVVNVLILLGQAGWAHYSTLKVSIDDWFFTGAEVPAPENIFLTALYCIFGAWLLVEFLRVLSSMGRLAELVVVIGGIAVLASVAGPMIGSITDQGIRSAEMAMAVGGAKDVDNLRENIWGNFLPQLTDVTPEGVFYHYSFNTGNTTQPSDYSGKGRRLFYPTYSWGVSKNPFSAETDYYLSVGLNSGLKEADFSRKKLNLVIVLDVSGSMETSFKSYYYDNFGNRVNVPGDKSPNNEEDKGKSKLQVACQSVVSLLDHLRPDDRFGMVLYDHRSYLAKPMRLVSETKMPEIKQHILDIRPGGGTNMEAGLEMGAGLLLPYVNVNKNEYENRVIFLTDAMPNTDDTSESGLMGITKSHSRQGVYFSFIGIGVDFNTELIESLTKIRGANYYSVHSPADFRKRLTEEFEYMVTPLVFNLVMRLDAAGFAIDKVYGSPEADQASGQIMKVNTLFPTRKVDNQAKGGLVLLKLRKIGEQSLLRLRVSYEDRTGRVDDQEELVAFPNAPAEFFQNSGVRKGILLARYVDTLKEWIGAERGENAFGVQTSEQRNGPGLGQWERQSRPLRVSRAAQEMFRNFSAYFEQEMSALNDATLSQELKLLRKLINYPSSDS